MNISNKINKIQEEINKISSSIANAKSEEERKKYLKNLDKVEIEIEKVRKERLI